MSNHQAWKWMHVALLLATAMTDAASAQKFKTLASFNGANGSSPFSSMIQGRDGVLYGTTAQGGTSSSCVGGCGTIFAITPLGSLSTLYSLCTQPNCADGVLPSERLILATDGNFYGTTLNAGANLIGGTVFKITPAGTLSTLYNFCSQPNCADGYGPSWVVEGADGNFYGVTYFGGVKGPCPANSTPGCGTVFKITRQGALTTLYNFCTQSFCSDGSNPFAGLVQGSGGSLYGVTTGGGTNCFPYGCGTVFEITPGGILKTLHSFDGNDGANPMGTLFPATDGSLYGTSESGGLNNAGTVFKVTPDGTLTTLYNFCAQPNCADGANPFAGVVQATDGNFYGTAFSGGYENGGTIFSVGPNGELTTLHSFTGSEGVAPWGAPIQATDGAFYGTTGYGGANNHGTVFALSTGLRPFVAFVRSFGMVGSTVQILGQGFKGTTAVSFNGVPASFVVRSATFLSAVVPTGGTTGFVTVTTPSGALNSNVPFRVVSPR
jgi:uncharacterized repeat protein (TIGR03803 family)